MKTVRNVLALAYFGLLLYIVFFARRRTGISSRMLNIVPFKNTLRTFQEINDYRSQYNFYTNLLGNFLLFLPVSFVFMLIFGADNRTTIFYAFLFSLSIEVFQYLFRIGVADIDDIILNVAGAFVGIILCNKLIKNSSQKNQ